jgi:membrane fusion protein (multidrug efflux system)
MRHRYSLPFRMHNNQSLSLLAVILLTTAIGLTGCDQQKAAAPAVPPAAVSVYQVAVKDVGNYTELVARTEASATASIIARVEGELREIAFTEGRFVEKDALLMRIDPSEENAALQQSAAEVENQKAQVAAAKRDLARGQDLADKKYLSRADLDKLKDKLEQSQAALKSALAQYEKSRIMVGYTEIRSPFSGRIGKLSYNVGNVVGPASGPLAEMVSIDPI